MSDIDKTDPYKDIHSFITTQEASYKQEITLPGGWMWSMVKHVETSFLYLHSQLTNGKDEWTPVKNIVRRICNLHKRTEGLKVKDIQPYVDNPELHHLSLLVKRYHDDVFVREFKLDKFLDEYNASRVDYGLGLAKKLAQGAEVVPLQSIAFCDQTDILAGPIGIKHHYSPDQLLAMAEKGWGDRAHGATGTLQEVIDLAREAKREPQANRENSTPGKYIAVYEIHGVLPKHFLVPDDTSGTFVRQFRIETFYKRRNGEPGYITLFAAEEKESPFKITKRDPVYGRALGFGAVEELFEAQVWTNYDMIRKQDMLDAASKTFLITQDPEFAAKHPNGLKDSDNLEIFEEGPDGNTRQLDTFPRNMQLFDKSLQDWEMHAQQIGDANDAILGESPTAGTPFKLQDLVTAESHGMHEHRKDLYAGDVEDLYDDWFTLMMVREITKGTKFLSELPLEELQYVTDCVVTHESNRRAVQMAIETGGDVTQEEIDLYKELVREEFKKKGSKHFVEILANEFKGVPIKVKVSVAGNSKSLAQRVDKLVNIFRFVFSNPAGFAQVMQIPGMAKSFNEILEASGLSPADFSGIDKIADKLNPPAAPPTGPGTPGLPPGAGADQMQPAPTGAPALAA